MNKKRNGGLSREEYTAFHEAGHAVAAYLMGHRIHCVSIKEDDDYEGRCITLRKRPKRLDVNSLRTVKEEELIILRAGLIATIIRTKGQHFDYWGIVQDEKVMQECLEEIFADDPEVKKALLLWIAHFTYYMFTYEPHWRAVEAVARELLAHQEIGARKATKIIKDTCAAYM